MNPVNLRLLASELNLSVGTVSKALKDSYEISSETKERVWSLAKKLNYTPNPYASSLRKKRSKTIAVVIPEIADSFFSLAIKGIEEVAQSKGYHVLVYLTHEKAEKEKKILEECRNGRVDGVLMSVSSETCSPEHLLQLCEAEVPLVFFDRSMESLETTKVQTNDYESGYLATRHLLDQGCRRIAYFSISSHLDINLKRLDGYKAALREGHFGEAPEMVVECSNDADTNHSIFTRLMTGPQKPDGVIASVEKLITPFYLMCNNLQLVIPDNVKVIAFSNLPTAPILAPALSTITQPALEMGKTAATLLFKALEKQNGKCQNETIVIASELCIRRSTAAH